MKHSIRLVLFSAGLLVAPISYASAPILFTSAAFDGAIKESNTVVVGFQSPSCGSCRVQKPNLEAILKEPEFESVKGLMADFDETKIFRNSLKKPVRSPSTIVIFKKGVEVSRIQGVTDKDDLRKLLRESL